VLQIRGEIRGEEEAERGERKDCFTPTKAGVPTTTFVNILIKDKSCHICEKQVTIMENVLILGCDNR